MKARDAGGVQSTLLCTGIRFYSVPAARLVFTSARMLSSLLTTAAMLRRFALRRCYYLRVRKRQFASAALLSGDRRP